MRTYIVAVLSILFGSVSSVSNVLASEETLHFSSVDMQVDELLSEMTPEQKVGQLLMVGVYGSKLSVKTAQLLRKIHAGGVILYSHNIKEPTQLKRFVSSLQNTTKKSSGAPLFVSVDQEGGAVNRIRKHVAVLPGAMAIGATGSSQYAYLAGKITGLDLASVGINMNLAPVLDVITDTKNNVIGIRSFGDDPQLVSQLGMWYIEGIQSKGIVATAKHFPGHGSTTGDSHYLMPVLKASYSDLVQFQLSPFQRAMDNGLDAVMTAHLSVSALDPSGLPATLSYNLLTNVMRKQMNFQGVIITDDLEMKAITKRYDIGQAAVKSVLAGSDVVMVGWTNSQKLKVYNALLSAHEKGKITSSRLDQSVKRILRLKVKRGLLKANRTPASQPAAVMSHPVHKRLAQRIADRAVTTVWLNKDVLPLKQDDFRKVLVVSPLKRFYRTIKFFHEKTEGIFFSSRPRREEITALVENVKSSDADLVVVAASHNSHQYVINQILKKTSKSVVVVSLSTPFKLSRRAQIKSYICAYGWQPALLQAVAKTLTGIIRPKGKLPLSLEPKPEKGFQKASLK